MTPDTTAPSYWLNWRFLLCAIWIFMAIIVSSLLIWRYEGRGKSRNRTNGSQSEAAECLNEDEAWQTCSKSIHPLWLLAFRITAFFASLALILADSIIHGGGIYIFYTQWTFTLVTIYFGLASLLSIYGCLCYRRDIDPERDICIGTDSEQGPNASQALGENADMPSMTGNLNRPNKSNCRTAESVFGHAWQIIFHVCAGAVVLTDSVFWLILYPFLSPDDFRLHFLMVCLHSVNAVFLLGDAILNCLRFSFFRIGYFVLWTSIFVVFQWIIHAFVSMRWPYPFLELSSRSAPLWYLAVGLLHLPCFGVFTLVFWIKRRCLSK